MKRWMYVLVLGLIVLGSTPVAAGSAPVPSAPAPGPRPGFDPDLLRALAGPGAIPVPVIVILRAPAGLPPLQQATLLGADTAQTRALLVDWSQQAYTQALAPLAAFLDQVEAQGNITARRDLWLIQGLAFTARPEVVWQLAASPAVAELRLDHYRQYVDTPEAVGAQLDAAPSGYPWGIDRIHAPEVWQTLAISGTGVVVAGMDTGVDWQHPALAANYRGNLGHGWVDHGASWFDAVNGGLYPYDDYGHGTHTLGTAVGQGGIGVAPGARWIAVKVFANTGYALDSWIHAGFQWLLAPGGNPALAPDLVNCSWSSSYSASRVFENDVALLKAAGILPIFAAGNSGPEVGSVGSPASLPGVFAVGATDADDDVPYFSGRGPSPWGEVKPYVVAPGVDVLSAVPGGVYQAWQGTSMATPHVTGIAALLHAADPTLPWPAVTRAITQTAVPLTTTLPNNDSGWGLVDAFAATVAVAHPGWLAGRVRGSDGATLSWATVHAEPHGGGGRPVTTGVNASGDYRMAVLPGPYDVTATAFGYGALTAAAVALTDTVSQLDFTLPRLPTGILRGQVTVSPTGEVPTLPVTVRVLATPVTATLDALGEYALLLPTGAYTVEARGNGYRVVTATVTVTASGLTTRDFVLERAPTLLLLDQGASAYESYIGYWRAALDTLRYAYDEVRLKNLVTDLPPTSTLRTYEALLWSAPVGSPGLFSAGAALTDYLDRGGRLLVSGQDVAYFDSGAFFYTSPEPYLYDRLGVQYLTDDAPSRELTGQGPFAGLTISIAGGDGADNQDYPDEVGVLDPDKAELLWTYTGGRGGGVGASICTPYRGMLFSFGYEAISSAAQRAAVLDRALDWLVAAPLTVGMTLDYPTETTIGLPGDTLTTTLRLRHNAAGGVPEAVTVTLAGQSWPATVTPTMATLAPCEALTLTVRVTIPPDAGINVTDRVTLTVTAEQAGVLTATLSAKTPAPVLLVDDDRWYPMQDRYTGALDSRGVPYDVWSTRHEVAQAAGAYSPPADILRRYPVVLWFTGYDWYQPITLNETAVLSSYLASGGRLALSSQDFLYYHEGTPLAQRLGVLTWNELPVEAVQGAPGHPTGQPWGPETLTYPFNNWSDVVEPVFTATTVLRGQLGQPVGLAAERDGSRTLFYGFALESLPVAGLADALEAGVGWLSPLGLSRWDFAPAAPAPGAPVTAALVLRYDGPEPAEVVFSHTLPLSLTLNAATLPPALSYDPLTRRIGWQGVLAPDAPLTFTWALTLAETVAPGSALLPRAAFSLPAWGLTFHREARMQVAGADLAPSRWLAATPGPVGAPFTLTLWLHNDGPGAVLSGTVDLWLMPQLSPLTATVPPTLGTALPLWGGALLPGESRPLTVTLRAWRWDLPLRVDALLADGAGQRWERSLWLAIPPWRAYLPLVLRSP